MVVNLYYTATSDLPISQITPTTSLWLQDGGESLLYCNIRLTHFTNNTNIFTVTTWWWWISTTLQHQTYPFHRQHQHVHCDYRVVVNLYYTATSDLPISQTTPTCLLWLQDGGESLLHCNIRLTHFTDNTNMFTVTTGWCWISTILQHQLTHYTYNTNMFTVTTWWWWISTTLQHQTYPFHR